MKTLKKILNTTDRIPFEFRMNNSLDEIKKQLSEIDMSAVTNEHVLNLYSLLFNTTKKVKLIEDDGINHTLDLEIIDDSHSYICNGIPVHNTINLPHDYPYEDFKDVYMKLYKSGTIKGGTTYREGTMASVLGSTDSKHKKETRTNRIIKTHAPKRPKDLPCDIHYLTAKGLKWVVIVGLYEDDPYEIFAFKQKQIQLPKKFKQGFLRKAKSGVYNLMEDLEGEGLIIEDIKEFFERDEDEALTRIISTALRHGADVRFVIEQLNKAEGNIVSFSKAIARTLKKYLKENSSVSGITCDACGSSSIVIEDGCYKCLDCGASKCS